MPEFNVLETFISALNTKKRYIDILGGRGRGGSHFATQYALMRIMHPSYFRGYFMRRVFNDIRDSLWSDLKDRIDEMAEAGQLNADDFYFNENQMRITYMPTGNKIISKGVAGDSKRKAKLKSLSGVTHVFIEEANEIQESEFNQLDDSLRTIKANIQIFRIFNPPPKQHWIWRDYRLHPTEHDGYLMPECKNDDILSIYSTYHDNIVNINQSAIDKWESYKDTGRPEDLDHYLRDICGLVGDGVKGRIYSGWQPIDKDDYDKIDATPVYGLDFGYSPDPTAIVEIKFEKRSIYIREMLYETELTDPMLVKRMDEIGIDSKAFIIGDYGSGGGKSIVSMRQGVESDGKVYKWSNFFPAIKPKGSVLYGVKLVQGYTVYVVNGSENIWNEYNLYRKRTDPDGKVLADPVDADNHLMDAIRYVVSMKERKLF